MKLAFCLFKYFPFGGLERDFLRIAHTCLTAGHTVHVYIQTWEGPIPANIKLITISVSALTNAMRAKQFEKKLSVYLETEKYDLVIGFNKLPKLDIYFAADPCYKAEALKKHGLWYFLLPHARQYMALEKAVFSPQSKTTILLLNPTHQQAFVQHYQTPASRFVTLFPGIAQDRKRPDNQTALRLSFRQQLGIAENDKILLMVGSNFHLKGVMRALYGLSSLPEKLKKTTYLWIVGKDNDKPFKKLAKKLGILHQVRFFGPREDVMTFYATADLLLHPAHQETAGMVLIEAIVAGLPILTTDNCGYAYYVTQAKAGISMPMPFEQDNFNRTVQLLLSQKNQLAQYRQCALDYANQQNLFSLDQQVLNAIEHHEIC